MPASMPEDFTRAHPLLPYQRVGKICNLKANMRLGFRARMKSCLSSAQVIS